MVLKKTCLTRDGNRAQWRAVDAHAATRRSDTRQSKKGITRPLLAGKPLQNAGQKFASESGDAEKTTLDQLFRSARRLHDEIVRHEWCAKERELGFGGIRGAPRKTVHREKIAHFRTGHPTLATILGGATDGPTSATYVAHKLDVPPKPS